MAFIRSYHKGARTYYAMVESRREGNKVRQVVIRYLGTKRPRGPQKGLRARP